MMVVLDTSTPSIRSDIEVAGAIKEALPESFLVMVGPHVSATAQETLLSAPAVDAIARREYDATLVELTRVLGEGPDRERLAQVAGLSYRAVEAGTAR